MTDLRYLCSVYHTSLIAFGFHLVYFCLWSVFVLNFFLFWLAVFVSFYCSRQSSKSTRLPFSARVRSGVLVGCFLGARANDAAVLSYRLREKERPGGGGGVVVGFFIGWRTNTAG